MAEKQILSLKPAPRLEQVCDKHAQRVQDRKHRFQGCDDSASRCESRPDGIFGKDTQRLGLLAAARTVVMHAFATPIASPVLLSSMTVQEFEDRLSQEERRVCNELQCTLRKVGIEAEPRAVLLAEKTVGMAIEECAHDIQADLVVVGSHGRTGIDRWLLGSVAEGVLANMEVDVLAVPASSDFTGKEDRS